MSDKDWLGPCDACGAHVGRNGYMIATGMFEGSPIVEVGCSQACSDVLTKRCDPEAQALLRANMDAAIKARVR